MTRIVLTAAAVGLVACGGEDPGARASSEASFRVDCLGMSVSRETGGTLTPLLGSEATPSEDELLATPEAAAAGFDEQDRCRFWFTGPLAAGEATIKNDVSNLIAPNSVGLFLRYFGEQWVMKTGEIVLDDGPSALRAQGYYRGKFLGPGGKTADAEGLFEWCEPSLEGCPYTIDVEYERPFQVSTTFGDAWGDAAECRVLVDRAGGGMQADLQIGSWRGVNVSQLFNRGCGQERRLTMNPNRLTFRAGGVTGPGRYGPFKTTDFGGTLLPHLEWQLPATFWFHELRAAWSIPLLCSETFEDGGFATQATGQGGLFGDPVGGPSVCEFSIDDVAEELRVSCSRVVPTYGGSAGAHLARSRFGELHLTASCKVEYAG